MNPVCYDGPFSQLHNFNEEEASIDKTEGYNSNLLSGSHSEQNSDKAQDCQSNNDSMHVSVINNAMSDRLSDTGNENTYEHDSHMDGQLPTYTSHITTKF